MMCYLPVKERFAISSSDNHDIYECIWKNYEVTENSAELDVAVSPTNFDLSSHEVNAKMCQRRVEERFAVSSSDNLDINKSILKNDEGTEKSTEVEVGLCPTDYYLSFHEVNPKLYHQPVEEVLTEMNIDNLEINECIFYNYKETELDVAMSPTNDDLSSHEVNPKMCYLPVKERFGVSSSDNHDIYECIWKNYEVTENSTEVEAGLSPTNNDLSSHEVNPKMCHQPVKDRFAVSNTDNRDVNKCSICNDKISKHSKEIRKHSKKFGLNYSTTGFLPSEDPAALKEKLRRNCCPFCNKLITNFGRHLVTVHRDQKEVEEYINVKASNLKEKKFKRAAISNKLRKEGNYKYSLLNNNVLIPTKRSKSQVVSRDTYVSCKFCFGLYNKKYFYLHLPVCEKYKISSIALSNEGRVKNTALSSCSELITECLLQASELLKKHVLPIMSRDQISLTAQSDPLIMLFGSRFYNTHRGAVKYASAKLRGLAKLLLEMKKINPNIKNMSDCLKPQHFDNLMCSVRNLSKFDIEIGECETPGVVTPLCSSLKKCCDIIRCETIKNTLLSVEEKNKIFISLDGFSHLMKKEWNHEVSAIAEQSRKKRKVNKEDVLPDSEDIRNFWLFLELQSQSAVHALKSNPSPKNYDRLSKIVIAQIITLNRRRPGEVALATIENYAQVDVNDDTGILDETTLTEQEKKNAKDLSIFYISASKNRKKVPVILTIGMKRAINILINCREKLNIQSHLLFPRPGNAGSYEGWDILGDFKKLASLKKPEHFTATGLRHHAATSSQLHAHDDTYTKRLAKFMGHDLQTHESYYEMPLALVQKGKVGTKLLGMTVQRQQALSPVKVTEDNVISLENYNLVENIDTNIQAESEKIVNTNKMKHLTVRVQKVNALKESDATGKETSVSDPDFDPVDTSSECELAVTPKKKCKRVRWTEEEKSAIYRNLGRYFLMKEAPERKTIKKIYENEPALKNRTLQQVVTYVNNIVTNKTYISTPEKEKIRRNFLSC